MYEFWGYEWWLPLWDLDLANFWSRVPLASRLGKNLQRAHLQKLEMNIMKRNLRVHGATPKLVSFAAILLRKVHLYDRARRIHGLGQYDRHPLAWYGIIPKDVFRRSFTGRENVNSYLAVEMLRRIFPQWRRPPEFGNLNDDSTRKTEPMNS